MKSRGGEALGNAGSAVMHQCNMWLFRTVNEASITRCDYRGRLGAWAFATCGSETGRSVPVHRGNKMPQAGAGAAEERASASASSASSLVTMSSKVGRSV